MAMQTERTPLGDQGLIPGSQARGMPGSRLRARCAQAPIADLPLFAPAERATQTTLPGVEKEDA